MRIVGMARDECAISQTADCDAFCCESGDLGRNKTATKIRKAATASKPNSASNPQAPWIQAISGTAEAITENVMMYRSAYARLRHSL